MSLGAAILEVQGLRVENAVGADIVDEISFVLHKGEVLAIVGESGCGKTTTASALLGVMRPGARVVAGTVAIGGVDLTNAPPDVARRLRGSTISYVPQDPASSLNPRHRVGAQIEEALKVHGVARRNARGAVRLLVEQVRLPSDPGFLRRYPFELSGGQQQRIAIAMALACGPSVVVLDEPTTGLDVTTQAAILDLLDEIRQNSGAAFIYVTHDLAVIDSLGDQVAVMYSGRIVELGRRGDVFRRPAHPYTALLLGSVPLLRQRAGLQGIPGTAAAPGERPTGCAFAPRCPLVEARCWESFPPVVDIGDGRSVRCWRASELARPGVRILPDRAPETAASRASVVAVEDISASYRRRTEVQSVVKGVSFDIGPGECVALVGESGSGKTTIGRCIVGLHRPDSGRISLRGVPLASAAHERTREQRKAIQIVFQNPDRSLNPRRTVADSIRRPLRMFDRAGSPSEEAAALESLLERVRLPTRLLERYPRELSGGERQRVAIARALAAKPSVLLCDEITSSLDVSIQAAIVSLLQSLRADGLGLLFITHNLALVNSIADSVVVLNRGEICEVGTTESVIRRPRDHYTQALLAAAPELSSTHDAEPPSAAHRDSARDALELEHAPGIPDP